MKDLYFRLLEICLGVLVPLLFCCVIRAVRGSRTADRLVAVNMMTTMVTLGVCALCYLLTEDDLADIALVFGLLGCLAVVTLTRLSFSRDGSKSEKKEASLHVD